jgi:hypothetical protein
MDNFINTDLFECTIRLLADKIGQDNKVKNNFTFRPGLEIQCRPESEV